MTRSITRYVLLSLIESEHAHTKMARFRKHFDLIEQALRVGVPRHTVIAGLKQSGLELSEATFNNYVNRLRKRQANDPKSMPPEPTLPSASAAPSPVATPPAAAEPKTRRPGVARETTGTRPHRLALRSRR